MQMVHIVRMSHAEAGAADEGEDEGGDPGQHHVGAAAARKLSSDFEVFNKIIISCFAYLSILSMLNIL